MRSIVCLSAALLFVGSLSVGEAAPSNEAAKLQQRIRKIATTFYRGVVGSLDPKTKEQLLQQLAVPEEELASAMVDLLLEGPVFRLSDAEAKPLLRGKFDDRGNLKKTREAMQLFKSLEIKLPLVTERLFDKVQKDRGYRRGLRLEFATRLIVFQAEKLRASLEQQQRQQSSRPAGRR